MGPATPAVKARIAMIDDHPLFREALALTVARQADFEVVGEAGNAEEALALARSTTIDVAILDILMPATSGITLASMLHEVQPSCRVLGLSVICEPGLIADMLRAHAAGHALKTQPAAEIIDAIRQVLAGQRYLAPTISLAAIEAELGGAAPQPLQRLTPREREVFELIIRGHSNDEIATKLFIARRTVETHRQRIIRKLSAHSVIELQRISARYGDALGR